jgi:hypothetical protein
MSEATDNLQQRCATALGWSLADVRSMSLLSLRDAVRPVSAKLAYLLSEEIQSKRYIVGARRGRKDPSGLRVRTITDVLRRKKQARLYADGSYNCPFCNYGVQAGKKWCENPACSASKYAKGKFNQTPERIRAGEAAHRARVAEETRRKRDHESAMKRGAEAREERHQKAMALITEARNRGACVACLNTSGYGPVKFVKHRGPCPKA